MDPLNSIAIVSASGMRAQGERIKVVAENVANAGSTGDTAGADPYRRKTITFEEMVDRDTGISTVAIAAVGRDMTEFQLRYDPTHPAADGDGFVKMSNVSSIIEMSNMREASRSYEANLTMLENARAMRNRLIDMIE